MEQTITPTRWQLHDLLAEPIEASLESQLTKLEQLTAAFESERDTLDHVDRAGFMNLMGRYEEIMRIAHRIWSYPHLAFAADTQDTAVLNLRSRVDQVMTSIQNRLLFFDLWIKSWTDDTAARLMPDHNDYRYFVETQLKLKPYTLNEQAEQIINLKNTNGIDAMVNLYDMIVSRFSFTVEIDGQPQTMTRGELTSLYRSPSAELRAAAYRELFRVYEENSPVLAQIYDHRVRDWHNEVIGLRHYPAPIAARNVANDIPDAAVDALLAAARANNDIFRRYFRLKAGWLGLDKLRRYDLYAPLSASDKEYPFAQAYDLVMESFNEFSPLVANHARRVFTENHIDAEIRPGKRGGAFCSSVLPEMTPYVLVNYNSRVNDVGTLAHELGHAIHSMLAADHSVLTFHSSLPLAETASTFAEMLLNDRLLAEETDAAARKDILAAAIDDAYGTIQRQAYFSLFEREAHRRIMDGESTAALGQLYLDNLAEQYGDAIELSDDFRWEWVAVPHFYHVPFYTYAYSFGQLLVFSLYRQYQTEGESFVPRYLDLLAVGGSDEPARVLQAAGFDITSTAFWQGGYDVLRDMVDELEKMG